MFAQTSNPYDFKYLVTGITGPGIKTVHLPGIPEHKDILFHKEQKFVRPEMPEYLKTAVKVWRRAVDQKQPNYISLYSQEIQAWEDREWERTTNGIWFWNNGVATYLTPFYYWYLSCWQTYFGFPIYRESDKEITYFLAYCENDPDCYGLLLNTIRRYGKSSLMGAYATYRATRNFGHTCGMQGEKDDKIAKFYNKMILKPFKKLPYYFKPTYDTSSTQTREIKFERAVTRGKTQKIRDLDDDEPEDLESVIEYRPSGESEYDGEVLHTYIGEEPGKVLACSVNERWKIVKPCLRKGRAIRGKAFMGTTVEFMDVTNKGGKAYKKLFFESDVDDRGKDGRTKSGLYAAFLPGDCAYEDFLDDWGHPMQDRARQSLLIERDAVKDNPKDYSDIIRKYPLYISEIFYISADKCVFNSKILQDRLAEMNMSREPLTSKGEFYWVDNKRFGTARWRSNPVNGWCQVAGLITDPKETNLVETKTVGGVTKYFPKNQAKHCAGLDPVDHRVFTEGKTTIETEVVNVRRSKPVMFVKRKYDSAIDGELTQEILEEREKAGIKFPYKTNRYIVMMDSRTYDPNIFNERVLLICWYFGCEIQIESQKPGTQNYFYTANCEGFLQNQYVPISNTKKTNPHADGTAASRSSIQEYTDLKSAYIQYFGHTICFRELIEDDLVFQPQNTELYDYSVAGGWTEVSAIVRPKNPPKKYIDVAQLMPMFDENGVPMN